jgi:hypothetical protein
MFLASDSKMARQCRAIPGIEFIRSDYGRQRNAAASGFAKIDPQLSVTVAPAFDKRRKLTPHQHYPRCRCRYRYRCFRLVSCRRRRLRLERPKLCDVHSTALA